MISPLSSEATSASAVDVRIRRVPTLLADGRELIYFDDADTTLGAERRADSRTLDERPGTANMHQDPLTGEWVAAKPRSPAPGSLRSARTADARQSE